MMIMHYWIGVVEDRLDPLLVGRVRVRIYGTHNPSLEELPTADLPWAQVVQPVTSAAITGVGTTPLGLVEGSTVIGFFADGPDGQEPVILGSLAGIPLVMPPKKYGFRDPEETLGDRPEPGEAFPRIPYLKEADTNRLARRQSIEQTIVPKKNQSRDRDVPIAFGGTWDQPVSPFNAEYPYNHVQETESGHVVEMDDTKGSERLHWYHRSGTFTEIDNHGNVVRKIIGDGFEIVERNQQVHIKGACSVTVDGSVNLYVKQQCNVEVDGTFKLHAHGDIELKAGGSFSATAGGGMDLFAQGALQVNTNAAMNLKARRAMNLASTIKTTIASPITEVALLKMNGMTISPLPPKPAIFSSPSVTNGKSVSSTTLPRLIAPATRGNVPIAIISPMTEADPIP